MNSKEKYIGISNRIAFDVIENAIYSYLEIGAFDKEVVLQHIKESTKGDNRAKKTLNHLSNVISRNEELLCLFKKYLGQSNYFQVNQNDRKAFILCLFCLSFPIAFEMLTAFGVGFKVQDKLNRIYILQKIGSIYGGNRAMHIAVEEVVPLLIECSVIKRERKGIYVFGSRLTISNPFIAELIIYTDIYLSGSKTILIEDLYFKPWYSFFDISTIDTDKFKQLINKKDSSVGKGYLAISAQRI